MHSIHSSICTFLVHCTLGLGVPLATQDSSASSPFLFSTLVLVAWMVGGMVMLTTYMFCTGAWSVVHSTTQKYRPEMERL